MWYTHGQSSLSLTDIANRVGALLTQTIVNDLSAGNLNALLNDLGGLNATDVYNLLNTFSTVIGYATSTDGVTWTIVNHSVLAGAGGGAWNIAGTPTVIKESPTSYKMWYSASTVTLSSNDVQNILNSLKGNAAQRKQAIISLLQSSATSIRYATSTDGIAWTPVSGGLAGSSGSLLDSVGAPSVIKDGATYRMWYTNAQTTLTGSDLDAILADPVNYGIDKFIQAILSKTGSSIGYATSSTGTTWTVQNPSVITGTNGVWGSAAIPSVLKKGSGYEMWYTRGQTNLAPSGITTLLHDLLALSPNLASLMTTLKSGALDVFLTDLDNLISSGMTAVRAEVANTSSVITYATSDDGITWAKQNSDLFVGSALWQSVGAPSVILDSGVYKMWYTRGMDILSAQSIVDMLQGTTSTIGYATGFNLVAETTMSIVRYPDQTDGVIALQLSINHWVNSSDNSTPSYSGGVNSYLAHLIVPTGMQIEVVGSTPFDSNTSFVSGTGLLTGIATPPLVPNNSPIVKIFARLTGSANVPVTLTISFEEIMSTGGMNVPSTNVISETFLRGDANGVNGITVTDLLFIAQYLYGSRSLTTVNGLNVASICPDGGNGDKITLADLLFESQYLYGKRNDNFQISP